MVLSKETDASSEASTIVAEAVPTAGPGATYAPAVTNTYNPANFSEQMKPYGSFDGAEVRPSKPMEQMGTEPSKDEFGEEGAWSHGICHCFSVFFEPLFWMACCCTPLVFGQLMTRLKLNWCANPDRIHAGAKTFTTVAIIYILYLFLNLLGLEIAGFAFFIYCLVVFTRTRGAIRRQFRIPAKTCGCCKGGLEDFCCALLCGCCTSIQLARQTHNEKKYPYEPCSPTGLPSFAPDLVLRADDDETIDIV